MPTAQEIDDSIIVSPEVWFEAYGVIDPKVGALRKFPDLQATPLQQRKSAIVEYCSLHKVPCRMITLKARQDGSSTFSVAIGYRHLHAMRATGCIIGGSHAQSTNLFRKLRMFADGDEFDKGKCKVLDRIARFANGSIMEQLTAGNPEVGRSGTYQVVIATEVARWGEEGVANAADVLAGLLKCVPLAPYTIVELESTARGASGDFYERWQGAITFDQLKAGEQGFVKVFAAWFEAPERRRDPKLEEGREQCVSPEKVEEVRLRYKLDAEQIAWMQWAVREECKKDFETFCEDYPFDPESAFRTSGRRRFNVNVLGKMVERARQHPPQLGNLTVIEQRAVWQPCSSDEARVVRWEEPRAGLRYLVAIDSMTGESQVSGQDPDNHAALLLRAGYMDPDRGWRAPMVVARLCDDWGAWERTRKYECRWDIDILEEMVWRLSVYYGNCKIVPEINMDRGLVELLKLRGADIYLRPQFNRREQTESNAYGWKTDDATREMMIENLARAIREDGQMAQGATIYDPVTLSELESFVVKGSGRSEASHGKHDDNVLALAIGLITIESATTYARATARAALPPDLEQALREDGKNELDSMAMRW